MADQNTPGDKKLSVPSKTLTLKPRVETGTVRQSFPHGRTKQVVVEKRGKRRVGGDGAVAEAPHARPRTGRGKAAAPATAAKDAARRTDRSGRAPLRPAKAVRRRAADPDRGRARRPRQRAGRRPRARSRRAAARRRGSQAPRQPRRHRTGRARSRRSPPQGGGRTPSPRRRSQAQGRARGQEALRRGRGRCCAAPGRCGCACHREDAGPGTNAGATPSIRSPGIAAEPEEDEGPRQIRRGPGGAMRPVVVPKTTHKPAPAKAARPPDGRPPRSMSTRCASARSPRSAAARSV